MDYTPKEPSCKECPAFMVCNAPTDFMSRLADEMHKVNTNSKPTDLLEKIDKIIDGFVDNDGDPLEEPLKNFLYNENHRAFEASRKTYDAFKGLLDIICPEEEEDTLNIPKG